MFYLLPNQPIVMTSSANNAVVSWKTKLSTIITTSSTEAERISAAYIPAEIAFLRKLAQELGFVQVSPTIIFEDNNGAITLGNSGHLRGVLSILIFDSSF